MSELELKSVRPQRERRSRKIMITIVIILVLIMMIPLLVVGWHRWIGFSTRHYNTDNIDQLPEREFALVLGTARIAWGVENPYFWNRIDAVEKLYRHGKIKQIVLSGDANDSGYDEPDDMRKALIGRGIDPEIILLDKKGYRTLDSVVRMAELYSPDNFIIVSQAFHNERAIYIANLYGLDNIYGYNARDIASGYYKQQIDQREYLARGKVILDWITGMRVTDSTL